MTNRERIFGVLRRTGIDRVPFIQYDGMVAPNEELWNALGRDKVGVLRWCRAFLKESDDCTMESVDIQQNGLSGVRRTVTTPHGSMVEERFRSPGLGVLAASRHFVQEDADYALLYEYLADLRVVPNYDVVRRDIAELGDDGFPLVAVERTPYQQMWVQWVRMDKLAVDLVDEQPELLACMRELDRIGREVIDVTVEAAVELGVPYIDFPDNLHAPVIGRENFRRYTKPLYQYLAERLDGTGIVPACHMDGDLKPLWSDIAESGIRAIDSLSPPPDNDTSVADALEQWPEMRLLINFPSSVHVCEPDEIYGTACEILEQGGHSGQIWIQLSENLPPGRWPTSLPPIVRAIDEFGAP